MRDPDGSIQADLERLDQFAVGVVTYVDAGELLELPLAEAGIDVSFDACPGGPCDRNSAAHDVTGVQYRSRVHRSPVPSADTSPDADAMMLAKFASMTLAERAKLADDLNEMCTALAIVRIRAVHGDLADEDLHWHLASRRYGEALANEVYGPRANP